MTLPIDYVMLVEISLDIQGYFYRNDLTAQDPLRN